MGKVRSAVIISGLFFVLSLSAVGCARQNTDVMSDSSMKEKKMDTGMEKSVDTMDAEKMDDSMKKDMQHDMK